MFDSLYFPSINSVKIIPDNSIPSGKRRTVIQRLTLNGFSSDCVKEIYVNDRDYALMMGAEAKAWINFLTYFLSEINIDSQKKSV